MDMRNIQREIFDCAVSHGWWPMNTEITQHKDGPGKVKLDEVNIPEKIALMHSELSEALEHFREGQDVKNQPVLLTGPEGEKPDGMWVELADCVIRILDLAAAYDVNMAALVEMKHKYNLTRPFRHGNKKC